jgi:hypothetical protein
MAKIKGLWKFNSRTYSACDFDEQVNFTINGRLSLFTRIRSYYFSSISGAGNEIQGFFGKVTEQIGSYTNQTFSNIAYDNGLDFGCVEQDVSDTFYTWLTAHATQQTSAYVESATTTATYKFDTQSATLLNAAFGWGTDANGPYYYAIIPLELGKTYTVTLSLQDVTSSARFRCFTADTDTIGSAKVIRRSTNHNGASNGLTLKFVADVSENFLICYGGSASGGEVLVTYTSDETPKTLITYNNETIATLEAGQTATIKTAETEVEYDIVVKAGNAEKVVSTHALYNGVKLPKISAGVLALYPYAFIGLVQSTGKYQILASKNPMYFANNQITRQNNDTEPFLYCTADELSWTYGTSGNYIWSVDTDRIIIWSNHNIPRGSATATDIYYEGTEPVPIEETETIPIVITYDGNEIAALEVGQTATVKCANTEADFDIVVKAESTKPSAPTVSGKWVLHGTIHPPTGSDSAMFFVSFQVNGIDAVAVSVGRNASGFQFAHVYDTNGVSTQIYHRYYGGWDDEAYKTWDFGTIEQIVTEEFLTWLKANATKQ